MTNLTKDNFRQIGSLLNDERFMNKDNSNDFDDDLSFEIVIKFLDSGKDVDTFLSELD